MLGGVSYYLAKKRLATMALEQLYIVETSHASSWDRYIAPVVKSLGSSTYNILWRAKHVG